MHAQNVVSIKFFNSHFVPYLLTLSFQKAFFNSIIFLTLWLIIFYIFSETKYPSMFHSRAGEKV